MKLFSDFLYVLRFLRYGISCINANGLTETSIILCAQRRRRRLHIVYYSCSRGVIWSLCRDLVPRDFLLLTLGSLPWLMDNSFSSNSSNANGGIKWGQTHRHTDTLTDTQTHSLTQPLTESRPSMGPALKMY